MADHLSATANIFQIVGFADTVFRVGKGLYELFDNARLASRNIALLLHQLQALLSVVAYVRVVLIEHASSPFAQHDGHTLPNVQTLLLLIEQDFRHLKRILGDGVAQGSGWLTALQSNVRWALKDKEVADARLRLSQYTHNLTAALSVSGRRNDIVLRTELQCIKDELRVFSQSKATNPMTPKVATQLPRSIPAFHVPRRQTRTVILRNDVQANSPEKKFVTSDSVSKHIVCREPRMTAGNTGRFAHPESPFIGFSHPRISIYEQADRTLVLDTSKDALLQVTKSILLLQDSLMICFDGLGTNGLSSISKAQANHLGMLLQYLVASAHLSSAEAIMKKYHTGANTELLNKAPFSNEVDHMMVQEQGRDIFDDRNYDSLVFLVQDTVTVETAIGSVKARILTARSDKTSTLLGFNFHYTGSANLQLPPFTVNYISWALERSCPIRSCGRKKQSKSSPMRMHIVKKHRSVLFRHTNK